MQSMCKRDHLFCWLGTTACELPRESRLHVRKFQLEHRSFALGVHTKHCLLPANCTRLMCHAIALYWHA